jgi:hypothetical protein
MPNASRWSSNVVRPPSFSVFTIAWSLNQYWRQYIAFPVPVNRQALPFSEVIEVQYHRLDASTCTWVCYQWAPHAALPYCSKTGLMLIPEVQAMGPA